MARITFRCHCGSIKLLSTSLQLPLPGIFVNSAFHRKTTGSICTAYVQLAEPPQVVSTEEPNHLQSYAASSAASEPEVGFCGNCGATLLYKHLSGDGRSTTFASVACIDSISEEFKERGVATIVNMATENWGVITDAVEQLMSDPSTTETTEEDVVNLPPLQGSCHCKGVEFTISRPPAQWEANAVLREWIKPGSKFGSTICWCDSCRTASGAPFWAWMFVPLPLLTFTTTTHLAEYKSQTTSEHTAVRRFCNRCGCTLVYDGSQAGGQMWDIAVGALDDDRARTEHWLETKLRPGRREAKVDGYVNGWKEGTLSFEQDGQEFWPELLEVVRAASGIPGAVHRSGPRAIEKKSG